MIRPWKSLGMGMIILLMGVGLLARKRLREGAWSSTNRGRQCSDFLVGQIMLDRLRVCPSTALGAIVSALKNSAGGKWG